MERVGQCWVCFIYDSGCAPVSTGFSKSRGRNSLRGFHPNGQLHFRLRMKRSRQTVGQTAYRLCMPSCAQQRPIYLPVLLDSNLIGQFNAISPNNTELSPCIALIKFSCKDLQTSRLSPPPLPSSFFRPKEKKSFLPFEIVYLNILPSSSRKDFNKETKLDPQNIFYFSKKKKKKRVVRFNYFRVNSYILRRRIEDTFCGRKIEGGR